MSLLNIVTGHRWEVTDPTALHWKVFTRHGLWVSHGCLEGTLSLVFLRPFYQPLRPWTVMTKSHTTGWVEWLDIWVRVQRPSCPFFSEGMLTVTKVSCDDLDDTDATGLMKMAVPCLRGQGCRTPSSPSLAFWRCSLQTASLTIIQLQPLLIERSAAHTGWMNCQRVWKFQLQIPVQWRTITLGPSHCAVSTAQI